MAPSFETGGDPAVGKAGSPEDEAGPHGLEIFGDDLPTLVGGRRFFIPDMDQSKGGQITRESICLALNSSAEAYPPPIAPTIVATVIRKLLSHDPYVRRPIERLQTETKNTILTRTITTARFRVGAQLAPVITNTKPNNALAGASVNRFIAFPLRISSGAMPRILLMTNRLVNLKRKYPSHAAKADNGKSVIHRQTGRILLSGEWAMSRERCEWISPQVKTREQGTALDLRAW